jgi:phospholipid transport system substrate-binding protein
MKRRSLLHSIFYVCLIVLSLVTVAFAGAPTELVKQTTDKVIDILKNRELKKPDKTKERRAAIRKTISERFAFEEMAKRSLALYWKQRTGEEQKEFVALYTDLLERTYIRKIESYTDEKFVYGDEKADGNFAVVRTKIITKKNIDIPIDYKMLNDNGQWVAYDVIIEGVSLVNNYRNQFNQIIHSGSYEDIVRRLKNKQIEGEAEDKAK